VWAAGQDDWGTTGHHRQGRSARAGLRPTKVTTAGEAATGQWVAGQDDAGGGDRRRRGRDWATWAGRRVAVSGGRRQATMAAGRENGSARENETARVACPTLKHFISDGYQSGRRT
jgi:hypothetical protein